MEKTKQIEKCMKSQCDFCSRRVKCDKEETKEKLKDKVKNK